MIEWAVQVVRHGQVVDIGTTCAERAGLDRAGLKEMLAELYAEERFARSKAERERRRVEWEAWEAAQEERYGSHGTESRYLGGCSRGPDACDECTRAAPHGTWHRFFQGGCSCQVCVEALLKRDDFAVQTTPVLMELATGKVAAKARLVEGTYGMAWLVPGKDRFDGHFVPAYRKRRSTVAGRGYTYATAEVLAWRTTRPPYRKPFRRDNGELVVVSLPENDDFGEPLPKPEPPG